MLFDRMRGVETASLKVLRKACPEAPLSTSGWIACLRREKQNFPRKRSGGWSYGLPCVTTVPLKAQIRGKQEV